MRSFSYYDYLLYFEYDFDLNRFVYGSYSIDVNSYYSDLVDLFDIIFIGLKLDSVRGVL